MPCALRSNGRSVSPGFKRSLFEDEEHPFLRRGWIGRAYRILSEEIWRLEPEPRGLLRRALRRTGRLAFLTASGFTSDRCIVRASALTFVTVLSLVPLLAVSFATLKGLGFYTEFRRTVIEPALDGILPHEKGDDRAAAESGSQRPARVQDPAQAAAGGDSEPVSTAGAGPPASTPQATSLRETIERVLDLVEKTDFTKLSAIALLVVLWAVLRLLGTIEAAFNEIWGVRRARSLVRKLTDYLAIVIVTPMFLVVAVGLTSADQTEAFRKFLDETLGLRALVELGVRLMPLLVGWAAFTFFYVALPNTQTRLRSSALGGLVAGTAWQVALVAHVEFQVGVANYNKIYSTFAAIPIFLVWVQLSWVIVLFGAELAFAHQHERDYRRVVGWRQATPAMRAAVALRLLSRAVAAFSEGRGALSEEQLASDLGVPSAAVEEVTEALEQAGVVAPAGDPQEGRWLLARDPARVRVADVLEVLEGAGERRALPSISAEDRASDRLLAALVEERRGSAFNLSLRELAQRGAAPELEGGAQAQPRPSTQTS